MVVVENFFIDLLKWLKDYYVIFLCGYSNVIIV